MSAVSGSNSDVEARNLRNKVSVTEEAQVNVEITETQVGLSVTEEPTHVLVSLLGTQGPRGGTIIYGATSPPSIQLGLPGDLYFNTSDYSFWGPKYIDPADGAAKWPTTPFFEISASRRYVHYQNTPSQNWLIQHDLGGEPSVTVVDSSKTMVIGEVRYISNTQIEVQFTAPFSGLAYLT
jgi:hypothetical protein